MYEKDLTKLISTVASFYQEKPGLLNSSINRIMLEIKITLLFESVKLLLDKATKEVDKKKSNLHSNYNPINFLISIVKRNQLRNLTLTEIIKDYKSNDEEVPLEIMYLQSIYSYASQLTNELLPIEGKKLKVENINDGKLFSIIKMDILNLFNEKTPANTELIQNIIANRQC